MNEAGVAGLRDGRLGRRHRAGRPAAEIVDRLHSEIRKALASPVVPSAARQVDTRPRRNARGIPRPGAERNPKWAEVVPARGRQGGLMRFDLVVCNGTVVDGTARRAIVPIWRHDGDRFSALRRRLRPEEGTKSMPRGLVVAPGFIDCHTHDDRLMLSAPDMAPKVSQGVTTVVAGNCGISLAPAPRGMNAPVLPPIDLLDDAGGWFRFPTFDSYVEELRTHPAATNCALLVGHTMLRAQTMADLQRSAGASEIAEMRRLTAEALAAGAYRRLDRPVLRARARRDDRGSHRGVPAARRAPGHLLHAHAR